MQCNNLLTRALNQSLNFSKIYMLARARQQLFQKFIFSAPYDLEPLILTRFALLFVLYHLLLRFEILDRVSRGTGCTFKKAQIAEFVIHDVTPQCYVTSFISFMAPFNFGPCLVESFNVIFFCHSLKIRITCYFECYFKFAFLIGSVITLL